MPLGLIIAPPPPDREPRINQFVIRHRGAEKLEGHHLGNEGHASCLGSPTAELRCKDQDRGWITVVILFM
jgi:hypothetical protein